MKQYLVDTLRPEDYIKLKDILDTRYGKPALGSIYWLPLPEDLYTATQAGHAACAPHVVALELTENHISCEFLVRTRKLMHCACMGYARGDQRNWILDTLDSLLEEAGVIA